MFKKAQLVSILLLINLGDSFTSFTLLLGVALLQFLSSFLFFTFAFTVT